jgi:hypothetical protein
VTVEELKARIAALEANARGRRFNADERREWNSLNEELEEVEARNRRLLELDGNPRATEAGATFDVPGARRAVSGPHADDKSRALRAIENIGLSARAGDRLDALIREDRSGIDSRYLAAVSDDAYLSAFLRKLIDPEHARDEFSAEEVWAVRQVGEAMAERA